MTLLLAVLLVAAPAQVLGVLEFRDKVPEGQKIDVPYLPDQVRSSAKEVLPSIKVITRENMLVLLQSSGKELAACEGECEVDTGRRIGAELVVSGELLRFGTQYKLNMKLHDTRSGELISGAVASGSTADELDRNLRPAVEKLLGPLRPEAFQDKLSDQRAAAKQASQRDETPSGFAFSIHAVAGYGYGYNHNAALLADDYGGALLLAAGLDIGGHLSRAISIAGFADVMDVSGHGMTTAIGGPLLRIHPSPDLSFAAGGGLALVGDAGIGWGAIVEADYRVAGPIAVHLQFSGARHLGTTNIVVYSSASEIGGGAGLSFVY